MKSNQMKSNQIKSNQIKNNPIILLGQESGKRTSYFLKAAQAYGVKVEVLPMGMDWEQQAKQLVFLQKNAPEGARLKIKIDPPLYGSSQLDLMPSQIEAYRVRLKQIKELSKIVPIDFLNDPEAIWYALDKKLCKERLIKAGIPTPPYYNEPIKSVSEFRRWVKETNHNKLFIKPRFGSGAAGVVAYMCHPKRMKEIVYTSSKVSNQQLINTKHLNRLTDAKEIEALLEKLLSQEVVIEQWVPKATFQAGSYDLRAVYQYGHVVTWVGRGSKGPITNLHLNNQAFSIEALGLSLSLIKQMEEMCQKTMALCEGLKSAGLDLLIHKITHMPMIVEVNGQGDLIYKDLEQENKIYKEQIEGMLR